MFGVAKEALEFHGNIAVKLEFYLDPADYGYEQTYVSVSDFTGATYKGKLDKDGQPRNPEDYQAWMDSLPRKWQLNPFHNHFIYLPPDYANKDVEREISFHLPNFYAAWSAGKTMRSGWATEKRIRPVRFDKVHPADYEARKQACLSRIAKVEPISLAANGIGRTFPATDIDIGGASVNSGNPIGGWSQTILDKTNPANNTGVIDTVKTWSTGVLSNVKVGTFYGSGTSWDDRDYQTLGTIYSGSEQTFTGLSIDVSADDIIGHYNTSQTYNLMCTTSGGSGVLYANGDKFGQGAVAYNLLNATYWVSLYGTGETASVGARLLSLTGVGN